MTARNFSEHTSSTFFIQSTRYAKARLGAAGLARNLGATSSANSVSEASARSTPYQGG